ncbi:hypothetical protein OHA40_21570 [Nocardia sp. NBC_00508]|nr:hypothetical protein OHA40_21570 [Nocardia sp. NBC_00508]
MQFLPGTWGVYAADGNGDGVADPHNVFDAALAAGKYLCSGGLDLRDSGQELRAVLRYNNSMAYAGNVLSWSAAYRSGGGPRPVPLAPGVVPPGVSGTVPPSSEMTATVYPRVEQPPRQPRPVPPPPPVMIKIPGLPPIPCGIFCPAPPPVPVPLDPCVVQPVPAPMPRVGRPGIQPQPLAPAEPYGPAPGQLPGPADPEAARRPGDAGAAGTAGQPAPVDPQAAACTPPGTRRAAPALWAPGHDPAPGAATHAAPGTPGHEAAPRSNTEPVTPEPEAAAEPAPPAPQPAITLPFGIVIPLPGPPAPQQ